MGLATLNRTRALRAQGTATAQRSSIPIEEHRAELHKQRKEYEIKLSHLAAEKAPKGGSSKKAKELETQAQALRDEFDKLTAEHDELIERVTERGRELGLNDDEIAALLNAEAEVPPETAPGEQNADASQLDKSKPKAKGDK